MLVTFVPTLRTFQNLKFHCEFRSRGHDAGNSKKKKLIPPASSKDFQYPEMFKCKHISLVYLQQILRHDKYFLCLY